NHQKRGAKDYCQRQDADDEPGPELLVPARILVVGSVHEKPCSADAWADETAVGIIINGWIVYRLDVENDVVGARRQLFRRNRKFYRDGDQLTAASGNLAAAAIDQAIQARGLDDEGLGILGLVHQLER